MLKYFGEDIAGKTVALSGFGNVTWGTATKLNELGAKVITISGPDGYIIDKDGISGKKVDYLVELRNTGKNISDRKSKEMAVGRYRDRTVWNAV